MPPQFSRKLPNHLGSPRKTIDNFRPKKSLNSKATRFNLSLQKQLHKKHFICLFLFPPKKSLKIISMQFLIFRLTNGFNLLVFFVSTLHWWNCLNFSVFWCSNFIDFLLDQFKDSSLDFSNFWFFFAFWRELVQSNFPNRTRTEKG